MTNETKHTPGRIEAERRYAMAEAAKMQAETAHDDYMRSQGNGSHDPAFTACIMERDRLRQQNAELVRACENALNAMCIGAKADETMLQACDSIRAILATVQS